MTYLIVSLQLNLVRDPKFGIHFSGAFKLTTSVVVSEAFTEQSLDIVLQRHFEIIE